MGAFGKKLLARLMAIAVIASLFTGFLMAGIVGGQPPPCPLDEDFSSWLPDEWLTDDWIQSNSSDAGGTSPEAYLGYSNITGDYAYLDSQPVDTTGMSSLTLEFKSFIDDYEGYMSLSYDCRVYTRAHGGDSWTDVTPWGNPISGNVGPDTYTVDIGSDIGSATQVRFEFDGFYWDIDYWFVDDVKICGVFGAPPSQVSVIYVCGDKLVYDAVNDVYFYPHLLNMLSMTKPQQQAYADQLNADAYGQITDWHFANLGQMMGLLESMTGQIIEHPGPNHAYGMNTDMYFPVTDITQPFLPGDPRQFAWTMGRTIDEAGAYIELPTGMPYPGGEFVESSWSGDVYLTRIPTEGQYHWVGTESLTFDDDLNWIADDAFTSPMIGVPTKCSAWYVSETGPPRPNPNSKYLHSTGGLFDITDPVGTQWHELWPFFCKEYHLSGWEDNGDGVLSYCDWIDIYEKPNGAVKPYHVEEVTITLNVTLDGERMFIELEGGYNATVLDNPEGTQWHEILPCFCREYEVVWWIDSCATGLSYCDTVHLRDKQTGEENCWQVEDVAIDIIVTPEIPPVGGEAYPVNKATLLAPWIAAGIVLAGGTIWYVRRRRKAQS
ncbi:hypothetical protein ACFLVV_01335 [Chloroflexota bacterium]